MRNSIALALAGGHSEPTARGFCNLAELLMRVGRLDELGRCVEDGLRFTRERGFWSHAYNLEVHRCLLLLRRGDWDAAADGLRALLEEVAEPGILFAYSAPWLGRIMARRGDPAAGELLRDAWERAQQQRGLLGLAYAGIALAEWAWLVADADEAARVAAVLLPRTEHPGAAPWRGELLRYLGRAGVSVAPFPGCPPAWAAGLAGEWRAASAAWRRLGDPYEAALELAVSGEPDAIADAVEVLDRLGAVPAADLRAPPCASSAPGCRAGRTRRRARTRRG